MIQAIEYCKITTDVKEESEKPVKANEVELDNLAWAFLRARFSKYDSLNRLSKHKIPGHHYSLELFDILLLAFLIFQP